MYYLYTNYSCVVYYTENACLHRTFYTSECFPGCHCCECEVLLVEGSITAEHRKYSVERGRRTGSRRVRRNSVYSRLRSKYFVVYSFRCLRSGSIDSLNRQVIKHFCCNVNVFKMKTYLMNQRASL